MKSRVLGRLSIRTFVLGANHGQLLQAYGMKRLVEEILPDWEVSHDLHHNHLLREIIAHCRGGAFLKMCSMTYWWLKLIKFSSRSSSRDITIFGADTIWMKGHPIAREDKFYFGHDINTGKLCSFSVSNAGCAYEPNDPIIGRQLDSFEFLGVRDASTADFVATVSSQEAHLTCDPAFFIDESFYSSGKAKPIRTGISVYAIQCKNLIDIDTDLVPSAVRGDQNWKLRYYGYSPSVLYSFSDQMAGPAEVLEKIQGSSLLITDTFHGVVMALITRTPFLLLSSEIVYFRLEGPLLEVFDNRRIIGLDRLISCLAASWVYDFDDLNSSRLDDYIQKSGEFLKRRIEKLCSEGTFDDLPQT